MGILVNSSDFVNEWQLSQKAAFVSLIDDVIANNERRLIVELFGATMGAAIIAEIEAESIQAKYQVLINSIELDDDECGKLIYSEGLRVYLKSRLYALIIREATTSNYPMGTVVSQGENSKVINPVSQAARMFNRAIKSGRAIQYYICIANPNNYDYNDYNGISQEVMLDFL